MTAKELDKKTIIKALNERVEGYESSDKSAFIGELLEFLDVYTLRAICRQQDMCVESEENVT